MAQNDVFVCMCVLRQKKKELDRISNASEGEINHEPHHHQHQQGAELKYIQYIIIYIYIYIYISTGIYTSV